MIDEKYASKIPILKEKFANSKPFSHIVLRDFLDDETAIHILKSLAQKEFHLKESDLFTFLQTHDLISSTKEPIINFREFLLSNTFISFIESITGKKLVNDRIDLFATVYGTTHYLLPHDDQLEGRKIAFIYYLSTLKKEDGGALALYSSTKGKPEKIVKRIIPEFNTFVFFEVSNKSFHQIEEVVRATQRIALTGWFYAP